MTQYTFRDLAEETAAMREFRRLPSFCSTSLRSGRFFTGMFEIVAGVRLRRLTTNEWALLLMGALLLLFGIFILFAPGAGALALVLWSV